VRLCVSDAHDGLRQAIAKVLGCPWQRCSVHFLRDMLGHVAKAQQPMIAAAIRGIFPAGTGQPRDRPPHRRGRHLPNDAALLRLAGALLIEQNDEWLVARRYLSQESLELVLVDEPATPEVPQLTPA
jgi:putative transposase